MSAGVYSHADGQTTVLYYDMGYNFAFVQLEPPFRRVISRRNIFHVIVVPTVGSATSSLQNGVHG